MTILSLILFALATAGTPGPNNTIAMASGATYGLRRTVPAIVGVNIGFPVMVVLVGLGLGQALAQWPVILDVLRPIGIAYLLYLAWKIASGPTDLSVRHGARPPSFLQLALFQFVNPKAWTMAVGAIAAYTGHWESFTGEVLVIGAVFLIFGTPCTVTWTLMGVGAGRLISKPAHLRVFNLVMAGLLVVSLVPAAVDTVESILG
ncbi:LysE family translocator [Nesterenkonia sp. HG001]|uniref:LysE family translocator n=1 Tax=Nesterenkonia sp. HG001 TaxID=2983207 RepID=UPI002AC6BF22|nr:LysE family translocator [Nesterenkonia sp. HG001]MDZ5077098.1 LysE family translocator [Nesterenkonia sp. HG001]